MKTVKDVFSEFKYELVDIYDQQEIESITLIVLNDLLKLSNAALKSFPETILSYPDAERINNTLSELKTGRPMQYILGHTEFYGLLFKVDPSVLIPRQETEELVQWIINTISNAEIPVKNILDIGTGSGCIAIGLKKYLRKIEIFAIDISSEALNLAQCNAEINNVDIHFAVNDILNFNYEQHIPDFEVIVSNPPYVTDSDRQLMHHNVIAFEPHTALFVPNDNPLMFYKAIADFSRKKLKQGGLLFFEINEAYGKETVEMLRANGFEEIELKRDISDKDRMVKAKKV